MLPFIVAGIASFVAYAVVSKNDKTDKTSDIAMPKLGAPVYSPFKGLPFEHSGIYIGDNTIISLQGDGTIVKQTPSEFAGGKCNGKIYVADIPEDSVDVISRAEQEAISHDYNYGYSLTMNNCHMYSVGSLSGDFKNKNACDFKMLEKITDRKYGHTEWKRLRY